jgi:TRAP-type C4-dicarboxylate transport system permease small subunit
MSPEARRPRLRDVLFGLYALCCLLALIWPGYDWLGNRIEPYVLGVPFSFAWVVGWVLLSFAALVIYHATGPADRGR